ncbi:MAG: 2-hydroxyacid dehydrogenase [Phascolarctobacterium sp.]|nr:2-hydroxyacid dehydrogenase [Phascolarctobacterium sp.]
MKIICMEPLGVSQEKIASLVAPLEAAGHEFTYYTTKETDQAKLLARVKDADILMLANQPLSAAIIEQCPNLKMLDIAFTGVDHVGLEAARARGIVACNAAGYSTNAVAELTFGLAISAIRNIVAVDERCRKGGTKDGLVGFELFGKTFGVVGTGAIGCRVAKIAQAFGCRVLAYSRTVKPELASEGVEYVDLDTLLAQSDFVSLHVPMTAATAKMINAESIAKMKDGAVLINCARGGVVDSEALAVALNNGKLAAAGIDVFENEPPLAGEHPLLHAKNTVVTPHVAFASKEALETRADIVFANIDAFLDGEPQNLVK